MGTSELFERYVKKDIAISMYEEGMSIEQIAKILKLTSDDVEEFISEQPVLV